MINRKGRKEFAKFRKERNCISVETRLRALRTTENATRCTQEVQSSNFSLAFPTVGKLKFEL